MSELCALDDVTVAFGGVKALDRCDFAVDSEAGITGMIGPNGAGKSTALSVLSGARTLESGRVRVLGRPVTRRATTTKVARWGVARTFQIPRPFGNMTVRENVMVARLAGASRRTRSAANEEAVDELLEKMELAPYSTQLASSLVLAQRKKLEVARALATQPQLILLDEVFEGLSESEIHELGEILRGLDAEGTRLLLVEHVLRALRLLATTLVVLEKGRVLAQGDVGEVLKSPRVQEAYLGFGGAG